VSSAYWWHRTPWDAMTSATGLQYTANRSGPSTDPWGTPTSRVVSEDLCCPSFTDCVRSWTQFVNTVCEARAAYTKQTFWTYLHLCFIQTICTEDYRISIGLLESVHFWLTWHKLNHGSGDTWLYWPSFGPTACRYYAISKDGIYPKFFYLFMNCFGVSNDVAANQTANNTWNECERTFFKRLRLAKHSTS